MRVWGIENTLMANRLGIARCTVHRDSRRHYWVVAVCDGTKMRGDVVADIDYWMSEAFRCKRYSITVLSPSEADETIDTIESAWRLGCASHQE